jgi:hypothetical protein
MTKRPLSFLLLIAALVLVGLNLVMGHLTKRLPYYVRLQAIQNDPASNLLFVGNSLLDRHLDEPALIASAAAGGVSFHPLNSAIGGSEPPEQRLLFQYAVETHSGISTLVVGFYDFQLTVPDHSHVADLKGNRMVGMDHRFSYGEVVDAYNFGALDRLELSWARTLPMVANRASAWRDVELMRRSMAEIGMPAVAKNSMGRVEDFDALESGTPEAFDAKVIAFLATPESFNASFEAIFREARERKMSVVLLLMPMSPAHVNLYYKRPLWGQYLAAVESLATRRGIRIIDASDWMPVQSDFVDHLHMTQEVKAAFSERLGTELARTHAR